METETITVIGGISMDNNLWSFGDTLNTIRRMSEKMKPRCGYQLQLSYCIKENSLRMRENGVSEWYFIKHEFPRIILADLEKTEEIKIQFINDKYIIQAIDLKVLS